MMTFKKAVLIFVILALLIPQVALAQSSPIEPLPVKEVAQGIRRAVLGMDGTTILTNGRLWLFGWQEKFSSCFVVLDFSKPNAIFRLSYLTKNMPGNKVSPGEFNSLVSQLKEWGWTSLVANAVPEKIWLAVTAAAKSFTGTLISPLVVPEGIFKDLSPVKVKG